MRFVRLLLGARLRLIYNAFRRSKTGAKIGWFMAGLALLAGAALSGFAGVGLARLLDSLQEPAFRQALFEVGVPLPSLEPDPLLRSLLSTLVLGVWGIIFLSSLGSALGNFYLSSDLELLMAAPIPMRAIFTAKFLEGLGLSYLLLFALGGPALLGLGVAAGYPWPYFVGALLVLAATPLIPESLGTLLVMPLARVIPPKRLREALSILGGLAGAAFYFFSQLPRGENVDPQTAGRLIRWLHRLHIPFLPQGWAAQGLTDLGKERYPQALLGVGIFLFFSLGLYALCLVAAERLYYSGWAGLKTAPATRRPRRVQRDRPLREPRFLPRQIQAILAKDVRLFTRDPQSWSEMLMPLAIYALILVQTARSRPAAGQPPGLTPALLGSAGVLFLCAAMVNRLSLGGIGSEGKQLWLLKSAPVSSRRILWAKFLAAYIPFLILGGIMLLGPALIARMHWTLLLGSWLLLALVGLGTTGIAVGLGASFPRLEAETQRQVVSTGAGCLYYPIFMLYAAVIAAALFVPPYLAALWSSSWFAFLAWVLWGIGFLAAVILTALALLLPLRIGAERLDQLEC